MSARVWSTRILIINFESPLFYDKSDEKQSEIYDHQMLLCDPNIVEMNKPIKKCLYGHINSYHLYEYNL